MVGFALRQCGERCWRSTGCAHALQGADRVGTEHDRPVGVPRAAPGIGCASEDGRCASRDVDSPQVAVREEAERAAVGRPEREPGPVGVLKLPSGQRIQRANPQPWRPVRDRHERHASAVGRDGASAARRGELELGSGRAGEVKAQRPRSACSSGHVAQSAMPSADAAMNPTSDATRQRPAPRERHSPCRRSPRPTIARA